MEEDIKTILAKRYKEIPQVLQRAITDANLPSIIKSLSDKYLLHVDQAGSLETEIVLVLLGLENSQTFAEKLTEQAKILPETAQQIAKDTNELIFKRVKDYLIDYSTELKIRQPEVTEAITINNPIINTIKPIDDSIIEPNEVKPNFVENKLNNIIVSNSEKISLIPKTETLKKTNPYLEPLE